MKLPRRLVPVKELDNDCRSLWGWVTVGVGSECAVSRYESV